MSQNLNLIFLLLKSNKKTYVVFIYPFTPDPHAVLLNTLDTVVSWLRNNSSFNVHSSLISILLFVVLWCLGASKHSLSLPPLVVARLIKQWLIQRWSFYFPHAESLQILLSASWFHLGCLSKDTATGVTRYFLIYTVLGHRLYCLFLHNGLLIVHDSHQ